MRVSAAAFTVRSSAATLIERSSATARTVRSEIVHSPPKIRATLPVMA
jgi:hypothetical protein